MTAGWRECADPVELAAAVAAGVEVLCVAVDGRTWETGCEDSESFRRCMANGCRYRVPASWSWSPEPPADVPTGAERYLAERLADPEYRAAYEAAAPVTGDDLRERIAWAIYADDVENERTDFREGVVPCYYDNADAVLAVLPPQPAPSPVPPWPGAVLSGLCDEDGEPTWLAQAGQVRGEQVRRRSDFMWVNNDQMVAHLDTVWVEVRAPRAVPEPETERVGVWDALMNERTAVGYDGTPMKLRRGQTILYTRVDGGGGRLMYDDASHPEDKRPLVDPDGTVEVLARDGDQ